MISPARIKRGIAKRETEFKPLTILIIIVLREIPIYMAVTRAEKARENAIGNFIIIRKTKIPNNKAIPVWLKLINLFP